MLDLRMIVSIGAKLSLDVLPHDSEGAGCLTGS